MSRLEEFGFPCFAIGEGGEDVQVPCFDEEARSLLDSDYDAAVYDEEEDEPWESVKLELEYDRD